MEVVEIEGQLSIFEIDETKIKLYEVLEANNYYHEIQSYYLPYNMITSDWFSTFIYVQQTILSSICV